jgi:hypothetical protein
MPEAVAGACDVTWDIAAHEEIYPEAGVAVTIIEPPCFADPVIACGGSER